MSKKIVEDVPVGIEIGTGNISVEEGRFDLMPIDVMLALYTTADQVHIPELIGITKFIQGKDPNELIMTIRTFSVNCYENNLAKLLLDVSKEYDKDAGINHPRYWEKGIPIKSYINKGLEHLFKHVAGFTDESHARAFVWNMMCAHWTCVHRPDLKDDFFQSLDPNYYDNLIVSYGDIPDHSITGTMPIPDKPKDYIDLDELHSALNEMEELKSDENGDLAGQPVCADCGKYKCVCKEESKNNVDENGDVPYHMQTKKPYKPRKKA